MKLHILTVYVLDKILIQISYIKLMIQKNLDLFMVIYNNITPLV